MKYDVMDVTAVHRLIRDRLFLGDTILNWFLGVVLTVFPRTVDAVLTQSSLAPSLIYRLLGVVFLLFAAWQTYHVVGKQLGVGALWFAALMAEGPVVLLTALLLFVPLDLRPAWRIVLWIGDVYMLLLGALYIKVGLLLARAQETQDV